MLRSILVCSVLMAGCQPGSEPTAELKFDSAHSIAVDATIADGKIISTHDQAQRLEGEIRQQLMYTIGNLNGRSGGPDMNRLQISVGEIAPREDGLFDVSYAADLFVSWPRETPLPDQFMFTLPARGDYEGRNAFFEAYGADEDSGSLCLDWGAHDVTVGIFWYYYRPEKRSCPLLDTNLRDDVSVRIMADFMVSEQNTEEKYPEYEKVWEDEALVVTAIFGKNEHGATGNDAGIRAIQTMYSSLFSTYGEPLSNSLEPGQYPDHENDEVQLRFATVAGELDIHLFLVDSIRAVDSDFVAKYNERTKVSDYVSYSGHSGLGANIRAMANMGEFVSGQYQIFLINGCDTFAYVDHALRDAHHAVNPEAGPDKYFDIITNAMPSYFHANARANMAIINGLVGQQQTYRQILSGFDRAQRAAVDGEGDNAWPLPFDADDGDGDTDDDDADDDDADDDDDGDDQ